jgi:Putative ATPase subunit of terminase (gpP-like)
MSPRHPKSSRVIQRALKIAAADIKALRKPKTPLELGRRLYEHSPLPVRRIAEIIGVNHTSLYRWARREGWKPRALAILHGNDHRLLRRFRTAAAGAAKKGLTDAEIARAFASRSPEELAAEREAVVGELWGEAERAIEKHNTERKRSAQRRERRQELEVLLLISQTMQSLLRTRKQLQGIQTPEAVRSREEIGASILALLDEMQKEGERGEAGGPKRKGASEPHVECRLDSGPGALVRGVPE